MTRQRNDNHSTEFGLWLRKQEQIDSKDGYVASNLDYIWRNYKTNEWMLIEEKRYNGNITYAQGQIFKTLLSAIKSDMFYGLFVIVFEKTSPDDGAIFINKKLATKDDLILLLQFDKDKIRKFDPITN